MNYKEEYKCWCKNIVNDEDLINELNLMKDDEKKIEDAFYKNLEFGTGGLRGVIGVGTNRMNIYTVAKASQGLSNYIIKKFNKKNHSICISYDSRIKSIDFAMISARVFANNGIKVNIYKELMPTPCLSFAVRELKTSSGIMITASHNPSKYNGYKVYGPDGCQITTQAAKDILGEIEKIDIFRDINLRVSFEEELKEGNIKFIDDEVYDNFINSVKNQSLLSVNDKIDRNLKIVYTPLNGTGLKPVTRALKEAGYSNIILVKEQENPDGRFPTCPYPNPEIEEAMALGIEYAKKYNADILLATDPDADRVGIAIKDSQNGKYKLLSGNQTGCLLLDYICYMRKRNNTMPKDPIMVKTIVTSNLGEKIANSYGVKTINVLTGFKFIGEQIGKLESNKNAESYIFGFEESYGYLSGSYVRDKDAVNAAFMICEMFSYYKTKGISLQEKLEELYNKHGYYLDTLHSYVFEGIYGNKKIQNLMNKFRKGIESFGDKKVIECIDYLNGINGLPKSDVLRFLLEDNCSIVIRPSGTEPKLKAYISVNASNKEEANRTEESIKAFLDKYLV